MLLNKTIVKNQFTKKKIEKKSFSIALVFTLNNLSTFNSTSKSTTPQQHL